MSLERLTLHVFISCCFQESGIDLTDDDIAHLIAELDKDGDGEINYRYGTKIVMLLVMICVVQTIYLVLIFICIVVIACI